MTTQIQGVRLHLHVLKDILEKWDKLCVWWKKKSKKGCCLKWLLPKKQRSHWWTLKLALESLFFFALEFLQNDRLSISSFCGIYFRITTTLRTLDSGTNIFLQRDTPQWTGNNHWPTTTVSDLNFCNNSCSSPWPFHRETEWIMTK